jgi:hypothetical protein
MKLRLVLEGGVGRTYFCRTYFSCGVLAALLEEQIISPESMVENKRTESDPDKLHKLSQEGYALLKEINTLGVLHGKGGI